MSQAYLLLDQAQIENLPERLIQLAGNTPSQLLYQRTAYASLEHLGPMLLPVSLNSPLAHTFFQEWSTAAGIWLESDAKAREVLAHLRSLLHARVAGDTTVLFRYYDPRIMALWLADLPPGERDRLMGPVRLIRLPDVVITQENLNQPIARYAEQPWLVLTPQMLDRLSLAQQQSFTHQLIEHCLTNFPEYLHGLDQTQQQQWAIDCQQRAGRFGYSAVGDVLLWARFHGELGAEFPDAPEQANYRQILAEPGVLPAQRLDNLNTELTRQQLTHQELYV